MRNQQQNHQRIDHLSLSPPPGPLDLTTITTHNSNPDISSPLERGQVKCVPVQNSVIVNNLGADQQAIVPFLGQLAQTILIPGKKQRQTMNNLFSVTT